MKKAPVMLASLLSAALFVPRVLPAQTLPVVAIGTLDQSRAGSFADLSGLRYNLENGVPANDLGGFGSAITWAGGNTFLALPDRGPNAASYAAEIDDTVSYINRLHTIRMHLAPNTTGTGLPYTLTPELTRTTLLWSLTPLVYGSGAGLTTDAGGAIGSGRPPINNFLQHFFTGRSDNFDPKENSGDPNDARFDTEGLRVSNDGLRVYISDEYGPYVYEFDRLLGLRLRSFRLPDSFFVATPGAVGKAETAGNTSGRTSNKGMEGLAITPDGRTLVGIMQNALIQDAKEGGDAANLLRIVTIDITSGKVTHQYGYLLTKGSGVSEMVALNNHEFLVDERDGKGRADGSNAKNKWLFKIDLDGATDISGLDGTTAAANTVAKIPFVDLVASLKAIGMDPGNIPAKIEGVTFGNDVVLNGKTVHTLWIANDNDFLATVPDANNNPIPNPNQFFVFGFTDADLGGSTFVRQPVREFPW